MRKDRPFADGLATGQIDPKEPLVRASTVSSCAQIAHSEDKAS
jgi:hypothetical protein